MLVVQQLPCSAKRAASQPVLSKLFLRARESERQDLCPMLSLFLFFFFSPPPRQPRPVYYCCSREANGAFVVLDFLPGLFGFMIAAWVLRFPRSAWHRSCWNWLVPPRLYQQRLMAGDAAAVPATAAFGGVVGYEQCNGCGRGRD